MNTKRWIIDATLALAVVALSGLAWSQQGEIARLDDALARMEARIDAGTTPGAVAPDPAVPQGPSISKSPPLPAAAGAEERLAPNAVDAARTRAATPSVEVTSPAFDPGDPVVRSQLREVIAQEEEARQEERWQRREERREERLRQRIGELAQKTGLDAVSTEQLTDLLVVEQAEISQLFRDAREDFSWEDARDKAQAIRAETDARAREILDDEAATEYDQMRAEEAARWRGPGFGGSNPRETGTRSGRNEPR